WLTHLISPLPWANGDIKKSCHTGEGRCLSRKRVPACPTELSPWAEGPRERRGGDAAVHHLNASEHYLVVYWLSTTLRIAVLPPSTWRIAVRMAPGSSAGRSIFWPGKPKGLPSSA